MNRESERTSLRPSSIAGWLLWSFAAGSLAQTVPAEFEAEIHRTRFGVVHVLAKGHAGLGYGTGYAYAQDNLCLLADFVVTVNGERSMHFGGAAPSSETPGLNNLESDVFAKSYFDRDALRASHRDTPAQVKDLLRGYVAGVNRYLRDTPAAGRDPACGHGRWVRELQLDDAYLMIARKAQAPVADRFAKAIVAAQPPLGTALNADADNPPTAGVVAALAEMIAPVDAGSGSNGYAFGRTTTDNASGLVLANPHLSWNGASRFYQLHWTIPGEIDVMGVALAGMPMIVIGFNREVAWMHPTTTTARFTLYDLALAPGDPTTYMVDGIPHPLQRKRVTVDVLQADGSMVAIQRDVWFSRHGPVWVNPAAGATWTTTRAFALRDVNVGNTRMLEHWLRLASARRVDDLLSAHLQINGLPWNSTVAADRDGEVLFAESSATPNLAFDQVAACSTSPLARAMLSSGVLLLDGARAACDWSIEPGTRQPGLMPPGRLPVVRRTDYVQNSNDSAWLSNPEAPTAISSPVLGQADSARRLRTRLGIDQVRQRLAGEDGLPGNKMSLAAVKTVLFLNRNHAAELVLDDLLAACRELPPRLSTDDADIALGEGCRVLGRWDRRSDLESAGAGLFREFWRTVSALPPAQLWAVPFDAGNPVRTPRGLKMTDPATRATVLGALASAVNLFKRNGLASGAALGEIQGVTRAAGRIPLHGGEEFEGVYNKMGMGPLGAGGYTEPTPAGSTGASYVQAVTWDDRGPIADAVLVYGQSSDPRSPYHADQTLLYAKKFWPRLPFDWADILADPNHRMLLLREPR